MCVLLVYVLRVCVLRVCVLLLYVLRLHLLLVADPPVIARISEGDVLIDVRTLLEGEAEIVREALAKAAHTGQ